MNEPFGRCVALALLSAFFLVAARPAVSIIVSATAFPGALDAWTEAAFAQAPGDDDGDGDDDDDGGGGGPGPGPGPDGPAAGPGGLPSTFDDDGFAALPPDCFEEALLRPSWLEDCEPIRRRAIAPPVIAVTPPRAAPAARRSPARFSPRLL